MLNKALTYCLQDDDPIRISELIGVREYQKQPKLIQSTFVTSSDLKQMIHNQKRENSIQSYRKIQHFDADLKPINRTFDFRLPLNQNPCRKYVNVKYVPEPTKLNQPKLYFGIKHQQFKIKIKMQGKRLEDMF
ncbi:unnamed protein product (macronuclear) [Paramecium tetraurelia]|uniref:Uncharacterized protein n=1 Tax=Paramecium tetraurelia TaxID=5888 RepID=A0DEK5_PARTE|nr:uncharacterized protein GSPATT00016298001 [Paramecium tetraurelia]CAK81472.1 unnamed protein product [Paramecium tetraurelia]|eukprot:XP_001448869.1 hypothetical protein (macronuclear) [Paramecium tetraurelia strain d4-2]